VRKEGGERNEGVVGVGQHRLRGVRVTWVEGVGGGAGGGEERGEVRVAESRRRGEGGG
jgi:hypothetical protein